LIEQVFTSEAPRAVGPYSQAIESGDLLFVSGQLPIDPKTGEFNSINAVEQTVHCLNNLQAIVEAAGTELAKTVKTTVLLTDLGDFTEVNRIYASFFSAPYDMVGISTGRMSSEGAPLWRHQAVGDWA